MSKQIENFISAVELEIQKCKMFTSPTETDHIVFERNCRNGAKLLILERFLEHVNKHKEMLGKEVYRLEKSFNYSLEPNLTGIHNRTNSEPVVLTQKLFDEFVLSFKEWRTKHLIETLLNGQISPNSSNPTTNLVNAWTLESTQEVIKFFKDFYIN